MVVVLVRRLHPSTPCTGPGARSPVPALAWAVVCAHVCAYARDYPYYSMLQWYHGEVVRVQAAQVCVCMCVSMCVYVCVCVRTCVCVLWGGADLVVALPLLVLAEMTVADKVAQLGL